VNGRVSYPTAYAKSIEVFGRQLQSGVPLPDTTACKEELERVLASTAFIRSERLSHFLRYIVEETLAGRADRLKEYSIGLTVYCKPGTYDPKVDATVRGEASRLRSRLSAYYAGDGCLNPLRIDVPKGSYVPLFTRAPDEGTKTWPDRSEVLRSLAILPLRPLAPVPSETDIALGLALADAVITSIGAVENLVVRPTSAVRRYCRLSADALAAAQELAVDAVLDGSFQCSGDRIRVTVQLLRRADSKLLWTARFEEDFRDLFAMQDAIAEQLAASLWLELSSRRYERPERGAQIGMEAYAAFARGRYHLLRYSRAGACSAAQEFENATLLAPRYASAHAGLALALMQQPVFLLTTNKLCGPKAAAAASTAVALNPSLPEAMAALATVQFRFEWNWVAAESAFKEALKLHPSSPDPYGDYGALLDAMGESEEAIRVKRAGLTLDPASARTHLGIGGSYFFLRRYDETIAWCQKALELDPHLGHAQYRLIAAHYKNGNYEECARRAVPLIELYLGHSSDRLLMRTEAYQRGGRRELIRSLLPDPAGHVCGPSPVHSAVLYSELGEADQAFRCLEHAYHDRDPHLVYLKVDPTFDGIRHDDRFNVLLARVGLI
jgi:TolB-like protein/Tfp pilus assembly protein PilF